MAESKVEEAQALKKLVSERVKVATKETSMDKIRQREKKYQKLVKTIDHLKRAKREEFAPLIEAANLVKVATKETSMDKIRQREKKYQKLVKTIDHLERAKREEFAPLIEAAYKQSCQQGLVEERERHKHEQQDKVMEQRRAGFEKRKAEWKEQITPIIEARKQEREALRKKLYYLRCEEEKLKKLQEEEAERQKQLEESLWRPAEPSEPPRPVQPAVAPSTEKYVVKNRATEDCPSEIK